MDTGMVRRGLTRLLRLREIGVKQASPGVPKRSFQKQGYCEGRFRPQSLLKVPYLYRQRIQELRVKNLD